MSLNKSNLLYQIALTKIPLIGPVLARNLVSYCGGVKEVFHSNKSQLQRIPGVGHHVVQSVLKSGHLEEAKKELDYISKHDIQPIFYLSQNYPHRLKSIKDAPIMLYYRGNANLDSQRTVGIVGTRKPTNYGIGFVKDLVEAMQAYQPLIVSGLAYGIDILAHRWSLTIGLPTIGVMGSGFEYIYPAIHKSTAQKMCDHGGLLTEFGFEMGPNRENFPMRNRIIAALSDVLIVVESKIKGGSMITAELANHYHKNVLAVPGRVHDEISEGCNFLVQTNRAQILNSVEQIAELMHWEEDTSRPSQTSLFKELTDDENRVCSLLNKHDPVSIDKLYKETGFTSSKLAALLLSLEFGGHIRTLPGKQYVIN